MLDKFKNFIALVLKSLFIGLSIIITFIGCFFVVVEIWPTEPWWIEQTSPLDKNTIEDLCFRLDMENEIVCRGDYSKPLYSPDFYPFLEEIIEPENGEWATFTEVEDLIGEYKVYQSDVSIDVNGEKTFEVLYDFKGDNVIRFVIVFDESGKMLLSYHEGEED